MADEEYKQKVDSAKQTVQEIFKSGQDKGISISEIADDIVTYLKSQGLTSFDLKTDGNRREASYLTAFTNGFNTQLKDILNSVVPELASALDVKKFGIWDVDALIDRETTVKQATKDIIDGIFTEEIIPGQKPFIDGGYTPQTLGEQMADRAGADIINLLGIVAAPQVAVGNAPATAYANTFKDPKKVSEFYNAVQNSINTLLRQYRDNPAKSFLSDVATSIGFSGGAELGETITETARETDNVGYYDTGIAEPLLGFGGAGFLGAVTQIGLNPRQSLKATGNVFSNFLGLKTLLNKFTSGSKKKQQKKVADQIKQTLEGSQTQLKTSKEIEDLTEGELKLTTAEQTESPALLTTQANIEQKAVGDELNALVDRRVNNINVLDESLEAQIPNIDKDVNYIIDLQKNKVLNLTKETAEEISAKQAELLAEQPVASLTKLESGKNLRNSIETAQFKEAQDVTASLGNVPAGTNPADADILDNLLQLTARDFETGTEPGVLNLIKSKIDDYLPSEKMVDGEIITEPAKKQLTNQGLFDLWLTASLEETSLLGKAGIANASKLTKVTQIKGILLDALETNLKDAEGSVQFFDDLNNYINKFETGAIVDARKKGLSGFQFRDEKIADAFFQTENVGAMDDFIRVFEGDTNAISNMEQAILDRIISKSLNKNTNLLNMDSYRQFLTQYKSVLDRFGTVSPDFVSNVRNKADLIDNITNRIVTLEKRKNFLDGKKLDEVFSLLGAPGTNQLKFGTTDEYVQAALKDNKVMKQVTDKILNQFPEAGDAWIKSVLDDFIKLRVDKNTGAISLREVKNLQNFLKENNESLSTMFKSIKGDKIGEEHLKNLNLIAAGFEKVNLVPPPKGSPAATPGEAMKNALGVDIPQVWSRVYAVQSGRTGWKFTITETLNRFLGNLGRKEFDRVLKQAIYDPDFAKTITHMIQGKESTAGDLKRLYGFLGKVNGIIGIEAEHGEDYQSEISQAEQKGFDKVKELSLNVSPVSRLNTGIVQPVDMPRAPTVDVASINPDTIARGQQIFGADDPIFGMAKGGIMNTKKAFQRVA